MEIKKVHALIIVVAMVLSVGLGVLLQKYYGVADILTATNHQNLLRQESRGSASNIPEEYQGKLQLFILAGQSNMAGWGDIPASGTASDPRVYLFGNDYHWKMAVDPIDDPNSQVDGVSEDPEAGFGPALPFASALLEQRPEMAIGLIPCATGNSSIYQWRRSPSDDTLYGSCLKRMRAASTMGNVAGLFFFQGEADALDPQQNRKRTLLPDQWAEEFGILVNDWRTDLDAPELPIVFAQIGSTTEPGKYPNWAVVQEQQRGVQLPFVAMIKTDDLPLDDAVHFTTESYRVIGRRFAEAYLELLKEQQK